MIKFVTMGMLFILAVEPDPLSGGSGWIGAGLLGCVLAWVMFIHLPGQNKMFQELLGMFMKSQSSERELDRTARHTAASAFQNALAQIHLDHREEMQKDRDALMSRQQRLEDAIKGQTNELRAAFSTGACKYQGKQP